MTAVASVRVDRIGQQAHNILCYSFLPADKVEHLLRLRDRVRSRFRNNAEVVGTDEAFFEDEDKQTVLDLYNEKAGILDGADDTDVDLLLCLPNLEKRNRSGSNP